MAKGLSEYEKKRLQRMKENEAFLKTLGLDLKTRRAEYTEVPTRAARKKRKQNNSDDDNDWIPGMEEVPRRSRRAKKQVSYNLKNLFKANQMPTQTKVVLKNVTNRAVKKVESAMDFSVPRKKGKGRMPKQPEEDCIVPEVELPLFFDDSNDPDVFYGFSDSECELDPPDREKDYHRWKIDSDMEEYFNSSGDESNFEGFDMDESFFKLYEEVKMISTVVKQSKREKSGVTTYEEEELSDDDEYLYCEECGQINRGDCPIHGPLTPLDETAGRDEESSKFTSMFVPKQLTVKESAIPNAGLGVFAKEFIPNGVRCGPYQGSAVPKDEVGSGVDTAYMWEVKKAGEPAYFIDGKDESTSNWLRYVNCACTEIEQNMVAFQYQGSLYYRTFRSILPGDELLVWYGDEYARDLGIDVKLPNGDDSSCDEDDDGASTRNGFAIVYRCLGCGSSFVEHCSFKLHLKNSKDCDMANPQTFTCRRCGLTFGRLFELQFHIRQHVASASPAQNHYHKRLLSSSSHDKPLYTGATRGCKGVQGGDKPYKCTFCDKAFNRSGNFKTHLRTHTGDKPYKCTYCDKAFNLSGNLKTHLRTHTGDKPYKCTYCDKAFNRSGNLKTHLRTHTGDKPYKCTYCDKAFNLSGNLKTHLRTHTGDKPYKCTYCDKACTTSGGLEAHLRTHTGDKPYKCTYCDKAFNQSGVLKRHLKTHTGDKPYKCTYSCDKAFSSNQNSLNMINDVLL